MKSRGSDAKLENLIEQVDWQRTTVHERNLFARSFSMMELATLANFRASSIRGGRLVSMIVTMMITLLMLLFQARMETIVVAVSAVQIVLFLVSQLFEAYTHKVYRDVESAATDVVKTLAEKYSASSRSDG